MDITTSKMQGRVAVTILQVRGQVDSSAYQDFSAAEGLLLDLAQVDYMSSAGIRSLNKISLLLRKKFPQERQSPRSSHLKLLNPQDRVFDVLKLSGVDAFFETHINLEKAVASF